MPESAQTTPEPTPEPSEAGGPLRGVLVADFSRVLAGPLATMTLADLGAEVIKIERPGSGDDTRAWGPPWVPGPGERTASYFHAANRNKRSLALDLKLPADAELARRLIRRADIVVDNFLPGALERAGLGDEVIRELNPRAIIGRVSGFGSAGGRDRPGYDFVAQALSGLMHITGEQDGPAMKAGVALVDVLTAKDLTIGLLAALRRRDRDGLGTLVEVNLLSSVQGALANQAQAVVSAGADPGRLGNAHPSICPYETLPCREGELAVAIGNDRQFARFTAELGVPQLAEDERFTSNPLRVTNRAQLRPLLEQALAADTAAGWERRLVPTGLAVGRVATIAEGIELAAELGIDPVIELERDGTPARGIRHPVRYHPDFRMPRSAPPPLDADGPQLRSWLEQEPDSGYPAEANGLSAVKPTSP